MKFTKRIFLILIACAITTNICAIQFRHLSIKDGLSQLSVLSIYQDKLGRMWFGTEEGINVFDGNNLTAIKTLRNIPPQNLEVRWICGDEKGNIYFQLGTSIVCIDFATQSNTVLVKKGVTTLCHHSGKIYYASRGSVYIYNIAKQSTHCMGQLTKDNIKVLHIDSRGTLWFGTHNGLFYFNKKTRRTTLSIKGAYVEAIFQDTKGNIWVSSRDKGCYRISPKGNCTHYYTDEDTAKEENNNAVLNNIDTRVQDHISSNNVRQIAEDNQGNIWMGTFFGLNRLNIHTGKFTVYSHTNSQQSLSHQSVFPVVKDNQGTLWLGTYYGGVNYFTPNNESFRFVAADINNPYCLSNAFIGNMTTDKRGDLWVCTEGGGLNCIDHNTHLVRRYMANNTANSLPQYNLKAIDYDPIRDQLYIGTYMGSLSVLDIKTGKFCNLQNLNPKLAEKIGNRIIDLKLYNNQLFFTTQNGLWTMNVDTYKIEEVNSTLRNTSEMYLHIDRKGYLWVADLKGIYKISIKTHHIDHYYKAGRAGLGINNFKYIGEDNRGRIYVASSGGGFYRLNESQQAFKAFNTDNSDVMSNFCYAFANIGNYIVYSTERGVGLFNTMDDSFRNMEFAHDFQLAGINRGCGLLAVGNNLFVGGIGGMVVMDISKIFAQKSNSRIYLSRLEVNGKICLPDDGTGIIDKAIYLTDHIHLKYDQNNIAFRFATDGYANSISRSIYEYRLRGYDDRWYQTDGKSIAFPKLPAGKYTLEIRKKPSAWQSGGDVAMLSMCVKVSPPLYLSTFAYIIYIGIIVALICAFYYFKRSQLLLETSLAMEKKDRQNEETLNKAKLQFFTSISHEFRTPLTLIIAKLDYVMQNVQHNSLIAKSLKSVNQNASMMLGLVNELLDFRKIEQGYTRLSVGKHNLVELVKDITIGFEDMARTKAIDFSFSATSDKIECWYDQRQMQKVVYNLIANAFKYVNQQKGMIEVRLDQTDEHAIIRVIDNGIGIASADIEHIFERFYQANNDNNSAATKRGTGIGLALVKNIVERHHGSINVLSSEGYGSMFVVELPKSNKLFSKDEIAEVLSQPETKTANNEPTKSEGTAKVLIVEDNNELLDTLRDIFSPLYTVITAHNGKEGLDMARAENPDIIVSDVMMPVMDGKEMCKAIKGDMSISHTPILLLTAMSAAEHEVEGLRCGADDYVAKPFNPSVLLARVAALMRMRSMLQQRISADGLQMKDAQQFATNNLDREFMQKCDEIISAHIADSELSVDNIARMLLMSRTNFYTKFKAITGMTPNEYILSRRLSGAAEHLCNNASASIADTAYLFGFGTPRYFSQCFKKHFGMNPKEWREKK